MGKKREFHAGRFGGCGFFGAASVLPLKVTFSAKGLTVLLATLFLGSAAWAAESQEHKDEDFTSPRELWVELHDGTGLDSTSVTGLRSEVESLYATAGIQIRWLTESLLEAKPYLARVYIMQKLPRSFDRRLWLFRRQRPMATAFGKSGKCRAPSSSSPGLP